MNMRVSFSLYDWPEFCVIYAKVSFRKWSGQE